MFHGSDAERLVEEQEDGGMSFDGNGTIPECEDKWLVCKDCKNDFLLEAGEQAFLHRLEAEGKKDHDGNAVVYAEPKRCRECRQARKARNNQR